MCQHIKETLAFIDNYSCRRCGIDLKNHLDNGSDFASIDLVVSKNKGGENNINNMALYCAECQEIVDKKGPSFVLPPYINRENLFITLPADVVLFRGDTRRKGLVLSNDAINIDYQKNKAKLFHFTNKHFLAYRYSTNSMNGDLRKNHNSPTITKIKIIKSKRMLNLVFQNTKNSNPNYPFNANLVFDRINAALFDDCMSLGDFYIINNGIERNKIKYTHDITFTDAFYEALINGRARRSSLPPSFLLNNNSGTLMKKKMIEKGVDGVVFEDTSAPGVDHAFISTEDIIIQKQYSFRNPMVD